MARLRAHEVAARGGRGGAGRAGPRSPTPARSWRGSPAGERARPAPAGSTSVRGPGPCSVAGAAAAARRRHRAAARAAASCWRRARGPSPVARPARPADGRGTGRRVRDTDGWLDGLAEHLDGLGDPLDGAGAGPSARAWSWSAAARAASSWPRPWPGWARPGRGGPAGARRDLLPDVPGAGPVLAAALARRRRATCAPGSTPTSSRDGSPAPRASCCWPRAARPSSTCSARAAASAPGGRPGSVDATMATSAPGVVAAGDVVGAAAHHPPRRRHRPGRRRRRCWRGPARARARASTRPGCPRVVWTDPQVAVVGPRPRRPRRPGGPACRCRATTAPTPPRCPGRPDRARGGFARCGSTGDGGRRAAGRGAARRARTPGETVAEVALVGRLGLAVEQWVGGRAGLGGLSAHHAYPSWSWTWALVADRLLGR